jgi:hypothetical protein
VPHRPPLPPRKPETHQSVKNKKKLKHISQLKINTPLEPAALFLIFPLHPQNLETLDRSATMAAAASEEAVKVSEGRVLPVEFRLRLRSGD